MDNREDSLFIGMCRVTRAFIILALGLTQLCCRAADPPATDNLPKSTYYAVCDVTNDGSHDHPPTPGAPCTGAKDHPKTWYSLPQKTYEEADKLGREHDCNCHMGADSHRVEMGIPPTGEKMQQVDFVVMVKDEEFIIRLVDEKQIDHARARLAGKEQQGIVDGTLADGDGGFNRDPKSGKNWSWHMVPETVSFPQLTAEVCDGRPSDVEEDKEHWIKSVKQFCPWSAKIVQELK